MMSLDINRNGEVICNTDFMAVSMDEYADLIKDELTLDAIQHVLFTHASLSWDKKSLQFDDKSLCHVLQALCTFKYNSKLTSLQKLEDENDGTDKSRE